MKTIKFLIKCSIILVITVLIGSCRDELEPISYPDPEPCEPCPDPDPKQNYLEYTGQIKLDSGEELDATNLTLLSVAESTGINNDGSFKIESVENEKFQFFFLSENQNDETIMFGMAQPGDTTIIVSDSTTAIGLLLINPSLIGTSQELRQDFVYQAIKHESFNDLIRMVKSNRLENNSNPADINSNPSISQYIIEIVSETMQRMAAFEARTSGVASWGRMVEIFDDPGNNIRFRNWRHVYYEAQVKNLTTGESTNVLLDRIEKMYSWRWWPPPFWYHTTGVNTSKEIEDGLLAINTEISTRDNLAVMLWYLLDMAVGGFDMAGKLDSWGPIYNIIEDNISISNEAEKGNSAGVFLACVDILLNDTQLILDWYVGKASDKNYAKKLSGLWKKLMSIYTVAQWTNEQFPFAYDWVRGPNNRLDTLVHQGGKLIKASGFLPPYAELEFSPAIGYGETTIKLRASNVEDDWTNKELLLYRWKIGEKEWTDYSNSESLEIVLSEPTDVMLEVKDIEGLTYKVFSHIPFYKSIKRTRIVALVSSFEDEYSDYLSDSLGYTNEGELQHVITGSEFNPSTLDPNTDLLMFSPYVEGFERLIDFWEEHDISIRNFVHKGGAVLIVLGHKSTWDWDLMKRSNDVLPFEFVLADPHNGIVVQVANSGEYFDFLGPLKSSTEGDFWIELEIHKSFNVNNDRQGIRLITTNNEPILIEEVFGQGIMLGAITVPIHSDAVNSSMCTRAIKYLVEGD